jgi:hypothetical protein
MLDSARLHCIVPWSNSAGAKPASTAVTGWPDIHRSHALPLLRAGLRFVQQVGGLDLEDPTAITLSALYEVVCIVIYSRPAHSVKRLISSPSVPKWKAIFA